MKKLCDYGCGREAKYSFKNGKWCCCKSHTSCPINIEKNRLSQSKFEVKIKHSRSTKKVMNQPLVKEKLSKLMKERWKNPEMKLKILKANKFTIEQIQEIYPFFSQIEEMKYSSDGEIQVHCKYSECENSIEKGGWFIPDKEQFYRRIYALEKEDGNDGRYFYCLEECKQKCCLYYFRTDPNRLNEFEKYHRIVDKETNQTVKKYFDIIENIELQGKEHGYSLDHKYSIYDGFTNNVDPEIIAHHKNLECISELENLKKGRNSSITLEELLEDIKKENVLRRG